MVASEWRQRGNTGNHRGTSSGLSPAPTVVVVVVVVVDGDENDDNDGNDDDDNDDDDNDDAREHRGTDHAI